MSRGLPKNVSNLLEKAKESALLAVDIYNKPKTAFRSVGFIVLMCIAWTSLLQAIFETKGTSYFYRKKNSRRFEMLDGDKKTWELQKCTSEYFSDANHPIRKNLEFFIELRNKIEHRFMPELDPIISGECQAILINFEETIVGKFGKKHSLIENLFVPLQLTEKKKELPKTKDGQKIIKFIQNFRGSISQDILSSQNYSLKVFLVPKIGNHRDSSDIAIEFVKFDPTNPVEMENYEKLTVAIREKQVPVANQGLYRPKKVLELIEKTTGIKKNLNWHTIMWKKYTVRPEGASAKRDLCNPKYCQWDSASTNSDYIYTQAWVDLLIEKEIKPINSTK